MIEAVYFDLAGVLTTDGFADLTKCEEGFGVAPNALQTAKNKHWLDLRLGNITEKQFWKRTFIDAGIEPADNHYIYFIEMVRDGVLESHKPYEHMFDLAKTLKSNGTKIGIMSNTCREWLEYFDNKFELSGLFDPIIPSYELGYAKPDGRYFSEANKRYGLNPQTSLFLDDQEQNVKAAKSAGYQAVLFRPY